MSFKTCVRSLSAKTSFLKTPLKTFSPILVTTATGLLAILVAWPSVADPTGKPSASRQIKAERVPPTRRDIAVASPLNAAPKTVQKTIQQAVPTRAQTEPPISFNNDVEPILTRLGCNQGACHGAQYGKGGYKLSLAAFDPDLDYLNTVKQMRGRRIALADPAHSLLLRKPLMRVPHGGGMRLEEKSAAYRTLVRWLQQGAPGPNPKDPTVSKIEISPTERVLQKGDAPVQLHVRALYSDGTSRDVTANTRLNTLNDGIAACTPDGTVTAVGRGQTAIMARYAGQATVSMILVPYHSDSNHSDSNHSNSNHLAPSNTEKKAVSVNATTKKNAKNTNYSVINSNVTPLAGAPVTSGAIDALVSRKQQQLGLEPSPLCDDRTFLRRISFDLIGTAPTPQEIEEFLRDTRPDKRARLIDTLLNRPEYADYWTLKWGDLLRSSRTSLGVKGMWSFSNWIHTQLQENRPIDKFVHDLIIAQGSTFTNGPANFYRVSNNPQDLAETTSQVFLGVRMQCAKCHHHPFEKWSQGDYYQFAAFFARVGLKGSQEFGLFGNEQVVRINDGGEVYHPKTGAKMRPTPLGAQLASLPANGASPNATTNTTISAALPDPDADGDRRRALADWLTASDNRLFSRNIANRYWGYLFGKGIVNPIDDMRVTNPPTNERLLDLLADELTQHQFDLKHLLRIICNTRTYQRSSQATPANIKDELFFTHYLPKRLGAETLLDAIDFACGTREKFNQLPPGTRAIQLPDPNVNSDFLDTFGRPLRIISCECERTSEPNLSQTLRLMNGELVFRKVSQGDSRITTRLKAPHSTYLYDSILKEIYLCTLGRPPRRDERLQVMASLAFAPDPKVVLEDVQLTLLNSKEFLFNH